MIRTSLRYIEVPNLNNTRAINIKSRTDSTTLVPSSSEDIYGETCERGYETIVFFQVVAIVFILDGRCSKICGFAGLESLFNIYISKYFKYIQVLGIGDCSL